MNLHRITIKKVLATARIKKDQHIFNKFLCKMKIIMGSSKILLVRWRKNMIANSEIKIHSTMMIKTSTFKEKKLKIISCSKTLNPNSIKINYNNNKFNLKSKLLKCTKLNKSKLNRKNNIMTRFPNKKWWRCRFKK